MRAHLPLLEAGPLETVMLIFPLPYPDFDIVTCPILFNILFIHWEELNLFYCPPTGGIHIKTNNILPSLRLS